MTGMNSRAITATTVSSTMTSASVLQLALKQSKEKLVIAFKGKTRFFSSEHGDDVTRVQ